MDQDVLQLLECQISSLTDSQRKVADYILKNAVEVAFLTIDQLSGVAKTSTSTIMRLAFSLGYSGYAHFQKDLQELLRNRVAPSTRLHTATMDLGRDDLLAHVAEKQIHNIQETVSMISEEVLGKVLNAILSARSIYCFGLRGQYSVAHYLAHGLNRALGNSEVLSMGQGDLPEKILRMNESDVLITITLPRYQRIVVDVAKAAKDRGVKVISMTDGYSAPIAQYTDILMPVSFVSLAFHNSIFGGMLLAEYIITSVALKQSHVTKNRLMEAEDLFTQWKTLMTK